MEDSASAIKWLSPNEDAVASINFIKLVPDLPAINDVNLLRDFYRSRLAQSNGGLIQVDIIKIHDIQSVKCIFKMRMDDGRMVYSASITIPFGNCSFVLKVQAAEGGITGMREAVITNKLLASNEIQFTGETIENWFSDPYDPTVRTGNLMNRSEQEIYDKDFPDHPLSIARNVIKDLEDGISFGPEIGKLKPFEK